MSRNSDRRNTADQANMAGTCDAVATAQQFVMEPVVSGVPFITYSPVAAYFGGSTAGLATLIAGAIIAGYFWLPPINPFALEREAWLTIGIYASLSAVLVFLVHNCMPLPKAPKLPRLPDNRMHAKGSTGLQILWR